MTSTLPPEGSDEREILKSRARELAKPQVEVGAQLHDTEVLIVSVGSARYALPLMGLAAVVPVEGLTPLPGAPEFVAGLAHVHGRVLTVVDLGAFLSDAPEEVHAAVLIERRTEMFALGVSSYEGVAPDPRSSLRPPPAGTSPRAASYLEGIAPNGVGLLRLTRVVDDLMAFGETDERDT